MTLLPATLGVRLSVQDVSATGVTLRQEEHS